jgi:predicted nucleic acid-binding protein
LILLDTSFLIRSLVAGSAQDRQLRHWLADKEPIGISSIAWAEFLCGPVQPAMIEVVTRFVTVRAAFDEDDAIQAAQLFNESGRRRGSLADCMIAATAIRARAALATSNVADFRRFCAAGRSLPIDAHRIRKEAGLLGNLLIL